MNDEGTTIIACKARGLASRVLHIALLSAIASTVSCESHPAERPSEVAEMPGRNFTVRVSAYPEQNGGFAAGAYYRFESRRRDGQNWVTAMEFRHDDPDPIPTQNVRFLNASAAYVFMGWKYAVTTDDGMHWQVWNAEKDLAGWRCCNYGLIKQIELLQSGHGTMILNPIPDRPGEVPELVTTDFGRHWNKPG